MRRRWETGWRRRRAAGVRGKLGRKTKPEVAVGQLERLLDAGLPATWAAYDEVYGRSGALRRFCESGNLAYVAVIPRDFRVTLPSGAVVRADEAAGNAAFERRSCGNGSKGPRLADRALIATGSPRHLLLIPPPISRPDAPAFYLSWAPEGTPPPLTFFLTTAARPGAGPARPPRLLPALVRLAAPPPGQSPLAPPQHPAAGRGSHLTPGDRKEVTPCNRKPEPIMSLTAT